MDWIDTINWNQLKTQKVDLITVINGIKDKRLKESLDGILNLIQFIQDEAVGTNDIDENEVFILGGFYTDIAGEFICFDTEELMREYIETFEEGIFNGEFGKLNADGDREVMGTYIFFNCIQYGDFSDGK